jgi:hypothetical protein
VAKSPKPISRETRIYLALWRKAYRERDNPACPPVSITATNLSQAISMRQGMYRAIRPYRYGEAFDPELNSTADLFVVSMPNVPSVDRGKPCKLTFKERKNLDELEKQLMDLGLDAEDLLTSEEREANASLQALMEPEAPKPLKVGHRISQTPFYTRED